MRYLLMREVRDILRISRPQVRRLIDSGELRAIKGEHRTSPIKVDEDSLREYIERHRVKASA